LRKNNKIYAYPNKIHILKKFNNNKIHILMLKLKKIDLLTKMTKSTINEDTDAMTTKNKEG